MTAWDLSVLDYIRANLTGPVGDFLMPLVTHLGDGGLFWIALCLLLLCFKKTRRFGAAAALSIAVEALLCNVLLKPLVARVRPYDVNTAVLLLVKKPADFSFPSGHAGASFAAAAGLTFSGWKWGPAALVLAALIGYSRLYLYLHYPTDVLAGALLGLLTGLFAAWAVRAFLKRRAGRAVKV